MKSKIKFQNSFINKNPDKVKFWDKKLNENQSLDEIAAFSHKKYYWVCKKGEKVHSFEMSPADISRGRFCPYHSNPPKKLGFGNDLQSKNPQLAKEWHPTKNELTPSQVFERTSKKFYWLCKNNHVWLRSVHGRTLKGGRGCPYCANRKVGYGNDLQSKFPQLAKEWHPKKNRLKPSEVVGSGTTTKRFWICKYGHEWQASLDNRINNESNCPHCSNQTSRPELYIFSELSSIFKIVQNRKKINNDEIDIFIEDINLGIEYDGSYFHKNKLESDIIKKRRISNEIKLLNVREHPLKKVLSSDLILKTRNKTNYFEFFVKILNHSIDQKFIVDKKNLKVVKKYLKENIPRNEKFFKQMISYLPGPMKDNSLMILNPKLSKQWHPKKNGNLTPKNFSAHSGYRAWWLCKEGHEWQQTINIRSRNVNADCPICSGYRKK